ncbi:hypothetical protein HWV23_11340 [Natronomonas halophila]|uniref:DUF7283 family protein n=1 Tax=Natronomonas halophila TaxID=2747817 RepID=UPI0015B4648D|nr:hypothetical protein [Natronomonas halophila]QLD86291.1 hypothetical protein HWV23_11340 [Natronomonas halophila]
MFDVPVDAWYVYLGLAVASGATVTLAGAMPAAAPPDATGAARTVDSVAASQHASVGSHPLADADAVRVGADTLSLRGPGGTTHAGLGYGPVVLAPEGTPLGGVLRGEPPEQVFTSPARFERAVADRRATDPTWYRTDRLLVRRVTWEGTDVVLVG